ncbi:MAG: hypothetical protein BRC33_05200 [Cyanobacteria bacterium SW_9_44_58]|nr:MAG: hypothetical protein BRC33_05200 [Cyanobacteria bacterium SW_9_44_58]
MSERSNREYLHDIQEASRRIATYTAGMTEQTFWEDSKTQDAVIRNLEIIGEATKNLTNEVRERYPEIPWKSMAGLRDRLIHNYFGVNLDIVWQIVVQELTKVSSQLEIILNENNL